MKNGHPKILAQIVHTLISTLACNQLLNLSIDVLGEENFCLTNVDFSTRIVTKELKVKINSFHLIRGSFCK